MGLFDDYLGAAEASAAPRPSLDPRSRELAIRTVLGEAADEPDEGMAGVAATIRNRIQAGRYGGSDVPRVVTKPAAYEPWSTEAGRKRMYSYAPDGEPYKRAAAAVDRVFNEGYDPTDGLTHFYSPTAQAALGRAPPKWAAGQEPKVIGRHAYYAPEGRVGAAQQPTEMSSQARRPAAGLFDDYLSPPATPSTSPPETSPPVDASPPADTGGRFTDNPGQSFRTAREGVSPTVATAGEAAKGGFFRGATFNFIDELKALAESGGVDPNDPDGLTAAIGLIKGAYRKATGDPEADAAYRVAASRERETAARQQEQQPGASIGGEVIGAIATAPATAGRVIQGAGALARAGQAARVGAVTGALSGAGEGTDLTSRATGAATSGAIGGTIGAVASPVVDVAARGVGRAAQEVGRYLFPSVERRAATMVDSAARSAAQVDPAARTRLTPAQAAATPESTVADVAGEPGRAIARWAANASPEARETLNAMIDPRFEGQAGRVVGWLNNTFNYPNAAAQQEAIETVARTVNRGNYARAYRDGADGLWSPELERLAGSDSVNAAMQKAVRSARDEGVISGYGAMNPRVTFNNGVMEFQRGRGGAPAYPDLQYWDLVRRELSDAARAATPGSAEARRLNGFATAMNAELDRMVPTYQRARQGAAGFFGAENALEAGQNFVTARMTAHEARQGLARMSPAERQLFQDGYVSSFIQKVNETGDRRNILNRIANSPADRERLHIALGPQRANELEAMLRVEGVMNLLRNQVQGNSTTARQLVELGAVGSYAGIGTYMSGDPQTLLQAAIAGTFVARGRNTDQRVARRVAEMLVSHNPAVFQRGLNMVANNRRMMDNIRGMDQQIARVGGQQAGDVPALQSMGIGRAENE